MSKTNINEVVELLQELARETGVLIENARKKMPENIGFIIASSTDFPKWVKNDDIAFGIIAKEGSLEYDCPTHQPHDALSQKDIFETQEKQ